MHRKNAFKRTVSEADPAPVVILVLNEQLHARSTEYQVSDGGSYNTPQSTATGHVPGPTQSTDRSTSHVQSDAIVRLAID